MLNCAHRIYFRLVGRWDQIINLIGLSLTVVDRLSHEKWFKLVEALNMMLKVALSADTTTVVHVEILGSGAYP